MSRALGVLLTLGVLGVLGACGEDPDEGGGRLDEARPDVDRAGALLGDALTEEFGGTTETGTTEYPLCSSAPVEGLRYAARWRITDATPAPALDDATAVAADAGWEVGATSEAEGFLPETAQLSRTGVEASISVDDGVIAWDAQTPCIRVTPEEASKRVGPAS